MVDSRETGEQDTMDHSPNPWTYILVSDLKVGDSLANRGKIVAISHEGNQIHVTHEAGAFSINSTLSVLAIRKNP